MIESLMDRIKEILFTYPRVDTIVIEQQLSKNIKMKLLCQSIMACFQTLFAFMNSEHIEIDKEETKKMVKKIPKIIIQSSKCKLNVNLDRFDAKFRQFLEVKYPLKSKLSYAQKKNILLCGKKLSNI